MQRVRAIISIPQTVRAVKAKLISPSERELAASETETKIDTAATKSKLKQCYIEKAAKRGNVRQLKYILSRNSGDQKLPHRQLCIVASSGIKLRPEVKTANTLASGRKRPEV